MENHPTLKDFLTILNSKNTIKIIQTYKAVKRVNKSSANRALFYARSIDGGNLYFGPLECFKFMAEKQMLSFLFLTKVEKNGSFGDINKMYKVATQNNQLIIEDYYYKELLNNNKMAFKWLPRKGRLFYRIANRFKMGNSYFRKFITSNCDTLETILCTKQYRKIILSKLTERQKVKYEHKLEKLKNKKILTKAKKRSTPVIWKYYNYVKRGRNVR